MHFAATRNPSVIDWTFPATLQEVWNNLNSSRRHEIALDCASSPERRNLLPLTLRHLANNLGSRSQTMAALREQDFAAHIVAFINSDPDALDELFRVYFSLRHKKMVAAFLECMPIRPTDGTVSSRELEKSRSEFVKAITTLLRDFSHDDVALYTQVLACQNPSFWGELPKSNFQTMDAALGSRTPQPPPSTAPRTYASRVLEPLKSEERRAVEEPRTAEQPCSTQDLQTELQELTDLFTRTADELAAATAELREGKLPSSDGRSLGSLAPAFARLVARVRASGEALGIASSGQALYSVKDIAPAIAALEEAEKAQAEAQRTAKLIEQVLSLATTDGRDFPPLASLKASARAVQQELTATPTDAALHDKLRAFELVLRMVDAHGTPGEDEDAEDVVAGQFGAKLLFALGSGRIVRSTVSEPEVQVSMVASLPPISEPQSVPALGLDSADFADETKAAFQS